MPEKVFIELGSNIQPEKYLSRAVEKVCSLGKVIAISNAYQNPAIADEPQADYINAAILIETSLDPFVLRDQLRSIEEQLDRVRTEDKYAPRTIDLDIALYGSMILEHPLLHVPDAQIYNRPHLAVTLSECDPEFVHPQTGEALSAIAERLAETASLKLRDDLDLSAELDTPSKKAAL